MAEFPYIFIAEIVADHAFDDVVSRRAFTSEDRMREWAESEIGIKTYEAREADPEFPYYSFSLKDRKIPLDTLPPTTSDDYERQSEYRTYIRGRRQSDGAYVFARYTSDRRNFIEWEECVPSPERDILPDLRFATDEHRRIYREVRKNGEAQGIVDIIDISTNGSPLR